MAFARDLGWARGAQRGRRVAVGAGGLELVHVEPRREPQDQVAAGIEQEPRCRQKDNLRRRCRRHLRVHAEERRARSARRGKFCRRGSISLTTRTISVNFQNMYKKALRASRLYNIHIKGAGVSCPPS